MYKSVFISYSHADQVFASRLAKDLESATVNVWLDRHSLKTGDVWSKEIEQAIIDQDICIIVLSDNYSFDKEWLKKEALAAELHDKSILPILLTDCEIPNRISEYQYSDFRGYENEENIYQEGISSILQALSKPIRHNWDNRIAPYVEVIQLSLQALAKQGESDKVELERVAEYEKNLEVAKLQLRELKKTTDKIDPSKLSDHYKQVDLLDDNVEDKETELEEFKRIANIKRIPADDLYPLIIQNFVQCGEYIEFGFIATFNNTEWNIKENTIIGLNQEKKEKLQKSLGNLDWETFTYETAYPLLGSESYFGLTKIRYYENKKAIVGFGSKNISFVANRVFSQIIKTFFLSIWQMLENSYDNRFFDARNAIIIEGKIFDNLRDKFQMDAEEYLDLRLDIFKKRLESIQIFFQPIIDINREGTIPYIDSFEALARCTIGGRPTLPRDIFETADKWGEKFKYVLDAKLFVDAIDLYHNLRQSTKGIRRTEDERPLAVNIHPKTLINPDFYKLVKKVVNYPRHIQAKNLIIEISEKEGEAAILSTSFVPNSREDESINVFSQFRKILKKYVDELGIHFAIDDFGKANASIPRLDALQPSIVKLDRDILLLGKDELKSTVEKIKTRKYLYPVKIVAEGYDKEIKSQLTLSEIQNAGVDYIQGYGLTGLPKVRLKRLTEKQRQKIKSQYAPKKQG